jgi:hypothetical protein
MSVIDFWGLGRAASAAKENPAVKALIATIPDDLSIPKFLQRGAA